MKKILAAALLLAATSSVQAASGFYLGIKPGIATLDHSGFEDAKAMAYFGGYSLNPDLAIEIEANSMEFLNPNGAVTIDTLAAYLASRTGQDVFFKVKIGYISEDIRVEENITNNNSSSSDTGLSYGVGLGLEFSHFIAEVEYTQIDADVSAITLGLALKF